MTAASPVTLIPVPFPAEVLPGSDLGEMLMCALRTQRLSLRSGDILVVKHKVVSKAEGRLVELTKVRPSLRGKKWAKQSGADARVVELALRESRAIVRKKVIGGHGVLITETHHGMVCANSGVDLSNVNGGKHALLLPKDPDRSAVRLRSIIQKRTGAQVAVIISDSFGRPFREGLTEVAIGVAGMMPLIDFRGKRDRHGYVLHATAEAVADELACAAGLVCGKLNGVPVCIVRGFRYEPGRGKARELQRARENDLFR
ncbi:MAG TPA: coenzyme F420-0:L-glutamate ligase [Terriglobales bacterium]|nr:coenzyme F420-0:L-glutamate ligase [Terriglobales bacterium]